MRNEVPPSLQTPALGWQLFENSPDCVKLLGCDGRILAMNVNGRCAMEIDDFSTVRGAVWKSFWPPQSHGAIDAALAAALAGRNGHFQAMCPTAKGKPKWWDVLVTVVGDPASGQRSLLVVSRDVTAAHQAERELRAAGERLADIIRQAPAFICVLRGPDHVFELINDRYRQLVGNRDLVGQPIRAALPEIEGQGYFELLDEVYRTGEPFVGTGMPVTLRRHAGMPPEERFIDFVYMPLRDADGNITGLLAHGVDQTHRRLADIAQREARERLLLATDAAELGLWSWLPGEDAVIWENRRPYEIFGLAPADTPANATRFVRDFLHPDDAARFGAAAGATLDSGAPFAFQGRIRRADGAQRWVEFFGRPQESDTGAPLRVVGTVSDITARKVAELALHESRERFEKIVSQAATGVVEMDVAGTITFANRKYQDMLGYGEGELVGLNVADVTAPGSLRRTRDALAGLLADGGGRVFDKHYLRKDGSLMPATSSVNALRGPDGDMLGLVAIVLDTTERERTARELRASEERYRTLFESMDQGFCMIEMIAGPDGRHVDYRFLEMNRMFEEHTGLHGATGHTAKELVPGLDDFWVDTYSRVAQTGKAARFESEAPAMARWFDVYATPSGMPGSGRVALLFSDITARKAAEATQRRLSADLAESDRRKTEFLATLAHELRNPLAPIRSGLAVMRLSTDGAAVAKVRDMMDRQVGHMVHLIDDLLDIARISGGKLELKREPTDLRLALASAVETSQPAIDAGRHQLAVAIPDEALPADLDVIRIAQVVANLLNNAAKYTPQGGLIRLSAVREGGEAVISVADNGVGIAAESIGGVFDLFSQVRRNLDLAQGGLGIGLSLVRRLVEMHGGSVSARSAGVGAGSEFTVRLPLLDGQAPVEGAGPMAERGAPPGKGLDVLVVDDNVDAAATLAMILELGGHAPRVAHGGPAALRAVRDRAPQVAFLDIGMPGMNGYETARAMRQLPGGAGIRLVALTGWGTTSDRDRSSAAGFDHHLTKPVQYADVEKILAGIGVARSATPAAGRG